MRLFDTHCHLHSDFYELDAEEVYREAHDQGIGIFAVGTSAADSQQAVEFAERHDDVWAVVGHHPHDAKDFGRHEREVLAALVESPSVIGIGECGLDYFYGHSPRDIQAEALRSQLDIAMANSLPVVFHVRGSRDNPADAFDDLWKILADYPDIRGVVHSFSAGLPQLEQILSHGLLAGVNGILTFTNDEEQLEALRAVPLEKIILETDAPFLTPKPFRGKINRPAYVQLVAEQIAQRKGIDTETLVKATSSNVESLFKL